MKSKIWHNPDCGTSRKALAQLQQTGAEVEVIDYRNTGFDRAELASLIAAAGLIPRQALRVRGTPAEALQLTDETDDDLILDAMIEHPILVERPFVRTGKGARLCRPVEKLSEIL